MKSFPEPCDQTRSRCVFIYDRDTKKGGCGTDENELMRRFREGDEEALAGLIAAYLPTVAGIIAWGLGSASDSPDVESLAVDVFFAAWENREKIRGDGIAGFLIVAARNRARTFLRKARREIPVDPEDLLRLSDGLAPPGDTAELRILTETFLDALDPVTRELFIRRYYFGQTVTGAAGEMGISLSAAKSRFARGREKLRQFLNDEVENDETKE